VRTANAILGLSLFTLRRIAAGRRWVASGLILALGPALALLILRLRPSADPLETFYSIMIALPTHLSPLLLALTYGIALTTSEVEDGTAGYVVLGALPRWVTAVVQVLVTWVGLSALVALSVVATYAITVATYDGLAPSLMAEYSLAGAAATLPYLAVVAACGTAFRRGIAVSVALAVIWEAALVRMPVRFAAYTIVNNVRALLIAHDPAVHGPNMDYAQNWAWPSAGEAATLLAVVTAVALAVAGAALSRRSLVRGDGS